MRSNQVRWEDLDPRTYENMVAVLVSRLYPEAQRIDGSGGDGGRDVQVPTDDGLVIFELKSFTGRMNPSRRRQVKASLLRASEHEPAEWCLIVPIDPTPGELDWFERIAEGYRFACRWRGRCWLDGEMAAKPEIARYYAHGQRYDLQELVDILLGIGADPSPINDGIVRTGVERASSIVDQLNELDPHYVFALNLQPGGRTRVSVIPRYPGAERERPWLRATFEFDETSDGEDARRSLEESLDFGTPSVIPAEFIAEMTLDVPAGLGARLDNYEMLMGSPAPDLAEGVTVALAAVDSTGDISNRLPLRAENASRGARGAHISLRDTSGAVDAALRFDTCGSVISLNWHFLQPDDWSPIGLLPAVQFAAAVEAGARVAVIVNGVTVGPQIPGRAHFGEQGDAARFARFLEHLVNVQTRTGFYFDVSTQLTLEEQRNIVIASRLLNGETVQTRWERIELHITPDGRPAVTEALGGPPPIRNIRVGGYVPLVVQGQTIPIGYITQILESARTLSWEAADDDSHPGTTMLCLVPADTNTVAVSLDSVAVVPDSLTETG